MTFTDKVNGNELVSVVIPLYNKEKSIETTINSVLAQTYTNFEIIVVDDGCTDRSAEIVGSIKDSRIRLISQSNAGVSAARNRGIAEAYGEYVALLDAGDLWMIDYLEAQISLAHKYPGCDVFAVNYIFRDEFGHITPTIINNLLFESNDGILTNYFVVASSSNPPICSISVMVRKSAFKAINGFPVGVTTGEDLLTWAKLASRYKIAYQKMAKAIYEVPARGTLRVDPKDMSLKNDIVRRELYSLLKEYRPTGWKAYMGFWDKMRAVINIKKGERIECLRYAVRSIKFNPLKIKPILLLVLTIAPQKLILKFLK